MNVFGSFSVVKNSRLSDRPSDPSPALNGMPVVPLVDGSHRRAMSKTVDDSEIDLESFAKDARVRLQSTKKGLSVTNKDMTFISQVLNKALVAGKPLFFFGPHVHCHHLLPPLYPQCALLSSSALVVIEFVRDFQYQRLLGNMERRRLSRSGTVSVRLDSSDK